MTGELAAWGLAFVAGLLGSAHCVGMCGAFVIGVGRCVPAPSSLRAQLAYAAGRVLVYGFLGAVMGLVGSFVVVAARMERAQGWVFLVLGAAVVGLGVWRLAWGDFPAPTGGVGLRILQRLRSAVPAEGTSGFLVLGGLNAFIPCGLLYTMELQAAATGSPILGMGRMLAFGLGTVPALATLGHLGTRLAPARRIWLDRVASAALVILGVQILLRAAAHLGWIAHGPLW